MKNLILISFMLLGFFTSAQQQELLENIWYLQEMNANGTVYSPPSNNEIENVTMEIYEEYDHYFFNSVVCATMEGLLNWITNEKFAFFDFAGGFECENPENEDFEFQYAFFYGEGGKDGIPLDYVINTNSDQSLTLIVTNRFGSTTVYSNQNLSLNEISSNEVKLYPNPINDILYLSNLNSFEKFSIRIYDMKGQLILKKFLETERILDLSHLSSGVYLLSLIDSSNKIILNQKIIKK